MNISTLIAISLTFTVGGCATTCQERDIYRPRLISAGNGTVTVQQKEVFVDINSIASFTVEECGWAMRQPSLDPVGICIEISVKDAHTFQLLPAAMQLVSQSGLRQESFIKKIEYQIFTSYNSDGSENPDSSTASPTSSHVDIQIGRRYGNGRTDTYSFDASAQFMGATSSYAPPLQRLISNSERRRRYFSFPEIPANLGHSFTLYLPTAVADGKSYALPVIEFKYSREPVCTTAH